MIGAAGRTLLGVISVVGLMFDLVGAVTLAWGLFRPAKPLYPGWARSPWEAVEDQAYGGAGAGLLTLGFTIQTLPLLGIHQAEDAPHTLIAAPVALLGGIALAYAIYGLVYVKRFPVELRRGYHALYKKDPPPIARNPQGWRWWYYTVPAERNGH